MIGAAWMFPGQGSQSAGMGRQLLNDFPRARMILGIAQEMSGLPLEKIRQRGSSVDLMRPSIAEPLITAINIGYADLLYSLGIRPGVVAGYSAGEVAALYAAGVFDLETALQVAVYRGQLFDTLTSEDHRMITCAGLDYATVKRVVDGASQPGRSLAFAAINAEKHFSLVGDEMELLQAESQLLGLGAETSLVNVAGRWHSSQLDEAAIRLHNYLVGVEFFPPLSDIATSMSGKLRHSVDELRYDLAYGVNHPVRWQSLIAGLTRAGIQSFIECGSGRVLFGLMRWNIEDNHSYHSICVEDRYGGMRPLQRYATELISKT